MPNYDAESDEVKADIEESAQSYADKVRRTAAVDFGIDEDLDPTDPYENAVVGQLGDDVDSETLASWNLRRIRQALGLSQQQVCDKLAELPGRSRLSQSQLAKIERGERPWRVNEMFDLAEALGINQFEFFTGQLGTDDRSMQVLAARLRYQRADDVSRKAEDAYKAALKDEFKAGLKLVHTSAYLGVKDDTALRILAGWAEIAEEVEQGVQELTADSSSELLELPHVQERRAALPEHARRAEAAREWAEKEWERLAAETRETAAELRKTQGKPAE